jgi:ribonucleotide monophosphatase NagD (HAD superfamily)
MPGSLGKFYRDECGGTTYIMGKPDPIIYDLAFKDLCLHQNDVLAVGDSLEHDIAGAMSAGVDTLFVAKGIHERDFSSAEMGTEGAVDPEAVGRIALNAGVKQPPTYTVDALRW